MEVCHHQIGWGQYRRFQTVLFSGQKICIPYIDHSVPQYWHQEEKKRSPDIRAPSDRNRLLRSLGSEWDQKPQCVDRVIEQTGRQQFYCAPMASGEYIEEREMEQILQNSLTPGQWLKKKKVILKMVMDIIWIIIRQWQSGQNRSDRNYDKHGFGVIFR